MVARDQSDLLQRPYYLQNHLARGGFAMRPLHAVVMGALGSALVAAGCGGAIPGSNGGPATLKLARSSAGTFLVDAQGHSLYLFEDDEHGESYCNGACAAVWPPLETHSRPVASSGVDGSALDTIRRDDGDMQVTYHGHPLYYYAADASTPGRTKGEDIDQFGAGWYLVDAAGKPIEPESGSTSSSSSSPGGASSGGGYR
jgi:predicted lipoprotein with Yx(FWY)xxD motif